MGRKQKWHPVWYMSLSSILIGSNSHQKDKQYVGITLLTIRQTYNGTLACLLFCQPCHTKRGLWDTSGQQRPDQTAHLWSNLTLCMLGNFACFFVVWIFFIFKLTSFKKIFHEYHQSVQIRSNILSGLIWVQINCKGYQQMTKVTTSGDRVKPLLAS